MEKVITSRRTFLTEIGTGMQDYYHLGHSIIIPLSDPYQEKGCKSNMHKNKKMNMHAILSIIFKEIYRKEIKLSASTDEKLH
ncbi:hypothetical protein NC651_031612 [Populus alba x Populus x berolinensis]|nr:hypothetical protein NC651_031612 [Populus alba x Populus x berolinensis]